MIKIGVLCPSEIAFRRFLPALHKADNFQYVGVAFSTPQEWFGEDWMAIPQEKRDQVENTEQLKAKNFQKEYGGDIFNGYTQLINSTAVDAIYLPLPPALHFKWAKLALEQGKHVLVEKPSTINFADTQELVALARDRGLALHENYMFVFHDQLTAITDIIRSGKIGDIRLVRITFGFPQRPATDFRYNKSLGGGALLDAGGYTLKLSTCLLGEKVKLTAASAGYKSGFDVDIYGSATVENDNGIVAQLAFGMDNDYRCDLEVWGSEGTLTTSRILTAPDGFVPTYTIKKNQDIEQGTLPADDAFLKSIRHFGQCVSDASAREKNYHSLLFQEQLVEEYKHLSKMQ